MFSKLAVVATAAFALLATAAPTDPSGSYAGQCSTGTQACCNSVQDSGSPQAIKALGSLAAQIGVGIPVGLTCTPVTVIGVAGGSSCSQQPVCCNKNTFNGVVALGCNPINAAL